MGRVLVGVDLGGTNVRIGIVSPKGRVLKKEEYPLDLSQGGLKIVEGLISNLENFVQKKIGKNDQLLGIGMGIAGAMDMKKGRIINSPNIPDLNGFGIREFIQKRMQSPIAIENDANAFALGEGWVGAAKGSSYYCGITLGTGVGGGIVINEEILHGSGGKASEVGHMVVDPEGPLCGCGGRGCLEVYASATGIKRMAMEAIAKGEGAGIVKRAGGKVEEVTAEKVFEAAQSGDKAAQKIFHKMGRFLGLGIVNLIHLFDPEKIVIGGKASRAWDSFIKTTMEVVMERVMEGSREKVEIVQAKCGDDAGVLGAAFVALKKHGGHRA